MASKFWQIDCYEGLKTLFTARLSTGLVTEKGIHELIRALISKYALSDSEILQTNLKKNTKGYRNYIEISRSSKCFDGKVEITFYAKSSNIDVSVYLVD